MEKYYYLDSKNQQRGPIEIKDFSANNITKDTLVWKSGMDNWKPASEISELSYYFTAPVPPIPPVSSMPDSPRPAQPVNESPLPAKPKPDNYLAWSILATVLCCLPIGVAAIVYSNQVDSNWNKKDYEGAYRASDNAKLFCILSLIFGTLTGIGYFFYLFFAALF